MSTKRPIRILHVVGGMNRGGVETWLMHVLRHIDRDQFQMDFLVHTEQPCAYDDEIRSLGSRIIPCMHPSRPLQYAINFQRILREYGPYDVVHSHVHSFSGYILFLARFFGVKSRIAHSHTDRSSVITSPLRKIYLAFMKMAIQQNATTGLAISEEAGFDLFQNQWNTSPRWKKLYYGINIDSFRTLDNRLRLRTELGLPESAFVVGHVGNFYAVKNHRFIIEVARELIKLDQSTFILLVGIGPLWDEIHEAVIEAGLNSHVIFTGMRSDVPQLMNVMDAFIFPSHYEGFGLVILEAQAAGLRSIVSTNVTSEVGVVPGLVDWLPLTSSAAQWADRLLSSHNKVRKVSQPDALQIIEKSDFNIVRSVRGLELIYSG